MIKLKQWEKLAFQPLITLPATEPLGDVDIRSKAIIAVLPFMKAGFNDRKFSPGACNLITARRTNPTWLMFCLWNGKIKIS